MHSITLGAAISCITLVEDDSIRLNLTSDGTTVYYLHFKETQLFSLGVHRNCGSGVQRGSDRQRPVLETHFFDGVAVGTSSLSPPRESASTHHHPFP
jgi:hypothetical protein